MPGEQFYGAQQAGTSLEYSQPGYGSSQQARQLPLAQRPLPSLPPQVHASRSSNGLIKSVHEQGYGENAPGFDGSYGDVDPGPGFVGSYGDVDPAYEPAINPFAQPNTGKQLYSQTYASVKDDSIGEFVFDQVPAERLHSVASQVAEVKESSLTSGGYGESACCMYCI